MPGYPNEAKIRDFLVARVGELPRLIRNLEAVRGNLRSLRGAIDQVPANRGGPSPLELLRAILVKRVARGLEDLHELELIGKEFKLLDTGRSGFQPSADILLRCATSSRLFLLEVKRHEGTERQAVTELSAYTHGLNNRLWNLAPADYVWMPISTEWRTTVRAAFAGEALLASRPILPLLCSVTEDNDGNVTGVDLELIPLGIEDMGESLALAQFAWDCFDVLTFELAKRPSDARTFVEFTSSVAARQGFSGCVLYGESPVGEGFPYPYVITVVVHNPFRAALKTRQLERARDAEERRLMVREPLDDSHDIDFRTMVDREARLSFDFDAVPEAPKYLSVREMAYASGNRIGDVNAELRERIGMFCDFESHPAESLKVFLKAPLAPIMEHVSYFGLMQEVVYERLRWEIAQGEDGDGPVLGDLGGDPLALIGSPHFLFEFMRLMNLEHESQEMYDDMLDEDGSSPGRGCRG